MTAKILCVDDDANVLDAFQRQLPRHYQIETATGGVAGLGIISSGGPFAVVVSDLRMPGMDGIEFLAKVKEISPDTVRIMLTGDADIRAAAAAVNQGSIFRFLTKPCSAEELNPALQAGIKQYRLITAERELLEKTLKGSIGVLTEILSILDPQSFGRACNLRDEMRLVAQGLEVEDTWELDLAAMLCEIGRVTVPAAIIAKEKAGQPLLEVEEDMLARVPQIGHKLLANIPRLEPVARAVLYQDKRFDGSGFPRDGVAGDQIPLGARIIKVLSDLNRLESAGTPREAAFGLLKNRRGWYDPIVLNRAVLCLPPTGNGSEIGQKLICSVSVSELQSGQLLLSNVVTETGTLLIAAGNWISESLLERIRNFARIQGIREPIKIEMIPSQKPEYENQNT